MEDNVRLLNVLYESKKVSKHFVMTYKCKGRIKDSIRHEQMRFYEIWFIRLTS